MNHSRKLMPAPVVLPGDEPFWDAAREGKWMAKWCTACSQLHYYPRMHCPFCGSSQTTWQQLSGKGTVHSYTLVSRASRPTAPAIVETDEGLRVHSVVVDADVHALRIGDPVCLRFLPTQGGAPVPAFTTPAADAARAYSEAALSALGNDIGEVGAAFHRAAVIGSGHMGVGITLALLAAGMRVNLVDTSADAVSTARQRIGDALAQDVSRGRLADGDAAARLAKLHAGTDINAIAEADVVIEAVWEDLAIKQQLFAQIDAYARPGALLATNTSTLDVGVIAAATGRPDAVIGLHFFNPAQVMRLLEIVRPTSTAIETVVRAQALAHRMGKVPVVVGICDGFVGNRLMITRERQAAQLLLEGALPQQVDRALRAFGLPMGTFELQDMAGGIALTYRARERSGQPDWLIEQLHNLGRTGLRAGRGYYRYEQGKRAPINDPEVAALIEEASRLAGVRRRVLTDDEIIDRLILPMINESAKLVSEGIVERASDIDLVWQFGYGWPDWKGGPVYYADLIGLPSVVDRLTALHKRHGDVFRPADLLVRLAASGGRLSAQPCESI